METSRRTPACALPGRGDGVRRIYACFLMGLGVSAASFRAERKALPVLTDPSALDSRVSDAPELVRLLESMPMTDPEYGAWWGTEEGRGLYEQIAERIGVPIASSLSQQFGVHHEPADVANTAFTVLRQDFVHAYIARATDPWSYLAQTVKRELLQGIGAHYRAELSDAVLEGARVPAPAPAETSIQDAVELTYAHLAPMAPEDLHASLREAITYFAELGGARLSHLYTHATTDAEMTGLGLGREEILAIANAVLGARPHHGQTSLVAAFLRDPGFDPRSSLMHRRALKKFESRMASSAVRRQEGALVG